MQWTLQPMRRLTCAPPPSSFDFSLRKRGWCYNRGHIVITITQLMTVSRPSPSAAQSRPPMPRSLTPLVALSKHLRAAQVCRPSRRRDAGEWQLPCGGIPSRALASCQSKRGDGGLFVGLGVRKERRSMFCCGRNPLTCRSFGKTC